MAKQKVNVDPFASTKASKRRAVTFYFDESTIARLHDVWIAALAGDPRRRRKAASWKRPCGAIWPLRISVVTWPSCK
jgi:hypothetical protein